MATNKGELLSHFRSHQMTRFENPPLKVVKIIFEFSVNWWSKCCSSDLINDCYCRIVVRCSDSNNKCASLIAGSHTHRIRYPIPPWLPCIHVHMITCILIFLPPFNCELAHARGAIGRPGVSVHFLVHIHVLPPPYCHTLIPCVDTY